MFHESNLKHSRIIAKLKQSPLCLPSSESVTKGSDILIAYSRVIAVTFYFFLCHLEVSFSTIICRMQATAFTQKHKETVYSDPYVGEHDLGM